MLNVLIGRFYAAIDSNFQGKGARPDYLYRYVERITTSKRQSDEPMVYETQVMKAVKLQLSKCHEQIDELHAECTEMRRKFKRSGKQLRAAQLALRERTNNNQSLKRKYELTKLKSDKLKNTNELVDTECDKLPAENLELLSDFSNESCDADINNYHPSEAKLNLQDIIGGNHKYSSKIRMLYYSLLTN